MERPWFILLAYSSSYLAAEDLLWNIKQNAHWHQIQLQIRENGDSLSVSISLPSQGELGWHYNPCSDYHPALLLSAIAANILRVLELKG